MLIQDKVRHSLIKARELHEEKEEIKYVIPHLYTAAKLMQTNAQEPSYDYVLVDHLNAQFRSLNGGSNGTLTSLDQVHQYMLEEIQEILNSRSSWLREKRKRFPIFDSSSKLTQIYEDSETVIRIPQETYFMCQQQCASFQNQAENNQNLLQPQISLEAVPSFLVKESDCCISMQRVKKLFSQHKLDQAYLQSDQCRKKVYLADPNLTMPEQMKQLLKTIEGQYEMMTYYYQFFEEPGYVFDKEDNGVTMHYKINEQLKEVSVKVEAQIDISIENFLCIVSEIELFQEFIPFTYDTQTLKVVDRNKKIGVSKVYLPLISDRIAYFYAAAYDRLSTHNSIFFYSKTITSDVEFQKKIDFVIEKDPEFVQLTYKFYIMEYTPLTANRGKIRLATNVNMRLGFLPFFIINKTCRIFAFDYFENLVKVNKEFKGSMWEKKMMENLSTYNFFKERIKEYLAETQ